MRRIAGGKRVRKARSDVRRLRARRGSACQHPQRRAQVVASKMRIKNAHRTGGGRRAARHSATLPAHRSAHRRGSTEARATMHEGGAQASADDVALLSATVASPARRRTLKLQTCAQHPSRKLPVASSRHGHGRSTRACLVKECCRPPCAVRRGVHLLRAPRYRARAVVDCTLVGRVLLPCCDTVRVCYRGRWVNRPTAPRCRAADVRAAATSSDRHLPLPQPPRRRTQSSSHTAMHPRAQRC